MTRDELETRLRELRNQWHRHPDRRADIEDQAARLTAAFDTPHTTALDPETAAAVHLLQTELGAVVLESPPERSTTPMTTPRHVIIDQPLRCFAQLLTAAHMAESLGATLHLTTGCIGRPTRTRPGMGSGCMPVDPVHGADRCRHDLAELRHQGAVDVASDIECWTHKPGPCPTCSARQDRKETRS